MIGVLWSLLGVLGGAFIAVQAPINAELAKGLGLPIAAAAVSFFAGAVVLGLITAVLTKTQGIGLDWRAPPSWMFLSGGVLGGAYVTASVYLAPRLGAASLMAFMVTGQLLAGMLVDRVGLFGLAVREISLGRVAGALLLIAGALMIRVY